MCLTLSDTVKECGGMVFIEAKAIFISDGETVEVTACAGVEHRKGMDLAMSFGASSSYARKYALNGLFLIDDSKDGDSTNKNKKNEGKPDYTHEAVGNCTTIAELEKDWKNREVYIGSEEI